MVTVRLLAATALSGFAMLAAPAGAGACSCAAPESNRAAAEASLRHADLSFIGVLRSVRRIGGPPPGPVVGPGVAFYRYRVIEAYEGDPGQFVRVRASTDGASCGLPRQTGRRYAMGADRARDHVLESGLCALLVPRALQRAAEDRSRAVVPQRRCRSGSRSFSSLSSVSN